MTTTMTSAPRGANDGTSKTYAGTQTAATPTTPAASTAAHQRKKAMVIRQIKPGWFRLDTDGLVFFGYTRDEVRHKFHAWLREYDLRSKR